MTQELGRSSLLRALMFLLVLPSAVAGGGQTTPTIPAASLGAIALNHAETLELPAGESRSLVLEVPALSVPAGQVVTVKFQQTLGAVSVQWIAHGTAPASALAWTNRSGRLSYIIFHAIEATPAANGDSVGRFLLTNSGKNAAEVQISTSGLRAKQASDVALQDAEREEAKAAALLLTHKEGSAAESLNLLKSAEQQWRVVEDKVEVTHILALECYIQSFPMNDGASALPRLRELVDLAAQSAADDVTEAANAWKIAAFIDAKQAQYQEASTRYAEALVLYGQTKDTYNQVVVLENRAKVERILGQNAAALSDIRAALPIAEFNKDARGELALEVERGAIAYSSGQLGLAYEANLRATELARQTTQPYLEALAWSDLGVVFTEMHDFDQAKRALDRAAAVWKKSPDPYGMLQTTEDQAELELARGDLSAARIAFSQGLEASTKGSLSREQAYFLHGLAVTEIRAKHLAAAREPMEQAVAAAEKIGDDDILSALYAGQGDLDAAQDHWEIAITNWERARAAAEKRGDTLDGVIALGGLVRGALHQGRLDQAEQRCQQAMTAMESIRGDINDSSLRLSFFSSRHALYDLCVQTELRRKDQAAAFNAAERGRARFLQDQAAASGFTETVFSSNAAPLTLNEIQSKLDDRTALVSYWIGEDGGFVWFVTAKRISVSKVPTSGSFRQEVTSYSSSLLSPLSLRPDLNAKDRSNVIGVGQANALVKGRVLEQALFPIPLPLGIRRLLIVKDGPLLPISFASLPMRPEGYLGGRFELVTEPSASFAFRPLGKSTPTPRLRAVVFTDPENERDASVSAHLEPATLVQDASSSQLPFAREEATIVASAFGKTRTSTFTGESASRSRALSLDWSQYQVAHFATHAVFRNAHPELSGLILANGVSAKDSGATTKPSVLTYADVLRMKANLDLVVLSACNSGIGRFVPGEGMMGLDNAFLASGSKRVIATLWPVDDEASSIFMGYFYRSLAGTHSPSLSLKKAQQQMATSSQWNSPYYWGAFVLSGDWHAFSE